MASEKADLVNGGHASTRPNLDSSISQVSNVTNYQNFEDVPTNTYKLDFSRANIYKYALKFHPDGCFLPKEAKFLSNCFYEYAKLDKSDRAIVFLDKHQFLVSHESKVLEHGALQLTFCRNEVFTKGSVKSFLPVGQAVYTTFEKRYEATQSIINSDHGCGETQRSDDDIKEAKKPFPGVRIATVFAELVDEIKAPLKDKENMVGIIDKICQREAHVDAFDAEGKIKLVVHGNSVFDFKGSAPHTAKAIELRLGVKAETHVAETMIRSTTPTHAFFLPSMNLEAFLIQFCQHGTGRRDRGLYDSVGLSKILKGKRIRKTYDGEDEYTIVDVSTKTPDEAHFVTSLGVTTVSEYMQDVIKIKSFNRDHIPCINVGPGKREILLPAKVCNLVPGQYYTGDVNKLCADSTEITCLSNKIRLHYTSIKEPSNLNAKRLMTYATSQQTIAAFQIDLIVDKEPTRALRAIPKVVANSFPVQTLCRSRQLIPKAATKVNFPTVLVVLFSDVSPGPKFFEYAENFVKQYCEQSQSTFIRIGAEKRDSKLAGQLSDLLKSKPVVIGIMDPNEARAEALHDSYLWLKRQFIKHGVVFKMIRVNQFMSSDVEDTEVHKKLKPAMVIIQSKHSSITGGREVNPTAETVSLESSSQIKTFSLGVHVVNIDPDATVKTICQDYPDLALKGRWFLVTMVGTWTEAGEPICKTRYALQEKFADKTYAAAFNGVDTQDKSQQIYNLAGGQLALEGNRLQVYRTGQKPAWSKGLTPGEDGEVPLTKELLSFKSLTRDAGCELVYLSLDAQTSIRLYHQENTEITRPVVSADSKSVKSKNGNDEYFPYEESLVTEPLLVSGEHATWWAEKLPRKKSQREKLPKKTDTFPLGFKVECATDGQGNVIDPLNLGLSRKIQERAFNDTWNFPAGISSAKFPGVAHLAKEAASFMVPLLTQEAIPADSSSAPDNDDKDICLSGEEKPTEMKWVVKLPEISEKPAGFKESLFYI